MSLRGGARAISVGVGPAPWISTGPPASRCSSEIAPTSLRPSLVRLRRPWRISENTSARAPAPPEVVSDTDLLLRRLAREELVGGAGGHAVRAGSHDMARQLFRGHSPGTDDEAFRVQAVHELWSDGASARTELGQPQRPRLSDVCVADLGDQPAGRQLGSEGTRLLELRFLERRDGDLCRHA